MQTSRRQKRFTPFMRAIAPRGPTAQRVLGGLLSLVIVIVSVAPIARFIGIALARINYPYELEWLEGGAIGHIQVVLSGEPIYRPPSFEFTPFLYPPLYYYVSALPSLLLGAGHLAPRLVSFVSVLGSFVLVARWVREETGDAVAGVAAAGLLSSVYEITCCWFDLARVDSLFLLLTLSANFAGRTTRTAAGAALTGALIACACFTKQLGIPLALPGLIFVGLRSIRLGLIATGVASALLAIAGLGFYVSSSGWIFYYLFTLPARHRIQWSRFPHDAQTYFLSSTFLLTASGVALLCGCGFARSARKEWLFNALFVGLACITSFLPLLKAGGYPNGLIPAYAGLALAAGIQLGLLRRGSSPGSGNLGPRLLACLLVTFQCLALTYDPAIALPTRADRAANDAAVARMQRLPAPVWVTASCNYNRLAQPHHGIHLDTGALSDVLAGGGREAEQLRDEMRKVIGEHHFRTIVLDRADGFLPIDIVKLIGREYVERGSVMRGVPDDVAWPKTGAAVRPDTIWMPRTRAAHAH